MGKRYRLNYDESKDVVFIFDEYLDRDLNMPEVVNLLDEKDERIDELENRLITSYREGSLQKQFDSDMEIEDLKQSQNNKAIEVLEKALELACEQIWAMSIWENEKDDIVKDNYKLFLDRANEILGENNNG